MLHGCSVVISHFVVFCYVVQLCVCMVLRNSTKRAFLLWLSCLTIAMVYCPVHRAMIAGREGFIWGRLMRGLWWIKRAFVRVPFVARFNVGPVFGVILG